MTRLLPLLALTGCLAGVEIPGSGGVLITEATNHNGNAQWEPMRFVELTNVAREGVSLEQFAIAIDSEVPVPLDGYLSIDESYLVAIGDTEFSRTDTNIDIRIHPNFTANLTRVSLLFRDGEGVGGTPLTRDDGTLQDQLEVLDTPSSEWHACRFQSVDETEGRFDPTGWVIRDLFNDDTFMGFTPNERRDCQ